MVGLLAVVAAAVATVFAQATSVRFHQHRQPHELAWTIALALFALAAVALFLGDSTGWDSGTYRAFYLLGAIVNVPWLALGTVYLLFGRTVGDRVRLGVLLFSGIAVGTMLSTPLHGTLPLDAIPEGKDHFDTLPVVLAGVGSGLAAIVLFAGALVSARRWFARRGERGATRLALSNLFIAMGTLVLTSGGLVKGWLSIDADEAFALCTALGISVIYAGFWTASTRAESRSARRRTLPANV